MTGNILCGVTLNSIMDRKGDNMSLDLISRVLVDIQTDSTLIIDDLFTSYQHSLLSVVNNGDSKKRRKYNLIIADKMNPSLSAKQLMNRSQEEDELKQVKDFSLSLSLSLSYSPVFILYSLRFLVICTKAMY